MLLCSLSSHPQCLFRSTNIISHIYATWENMMLLPQPHWRTQSLLRLSWLHLPRHLYSSVTIACWPHREVFKSHCLLRYAQEGRHCAKSILRFLTLPLTPYPLPLDPLGGGKAPPSLLQPSHGENGRTQALPKDLSTFKLHSVSSTSQK